MQHWIFFLLFSGAELLEQKEYKQAIEQLKKEKEPSLALAIAYLRDQQEEEALIAYINLLNSSKKLSEKVPERDMKRYNELFALYLANDPKLDEEFVKEPSTNYMCQFLQAARLANARNYEDFFSTFYQSYIRYADCHMALKTQGVIASLIYQRTKSVESKEIWRKKATGLFTKALEKQPQDVSLHKMIIYTASASEKKEAVSFVINQVINKNVLLERKEIPFYINNALLVDDVLLAESLLDKAKTWYDYSRILDEMQDLVAQHKAKR